MTTFKNFTIKRPIVLIINDDTSIYTQKIKYFFKGKSNLKIYDSGFDMEKILKLNPRLVIDINEDKRTRGIYVNCSNSILDKIKYIISKNIDIPFIGKHQTNKNKKLELQLFKNGTPYCYIEFPSSGFENKTIIKNILTILNRIVNYFK